MNGIFAPNESSAFAVMRVLKDNGWAGNVKFVGFDSSEGLLAGLRDGTIDALVVQDPVRMGYLSVVNIVRHSAASASSRESTPACTSSPARHWIGPRSSSSCSRICRDELVGTGRRALRDARYRQAVRRDHRPRRVDLAVAAGEVRTRRRERRRQEHVDGTAGALRADAGAMTLDSRPFAPAYPMAARRAGVAMIYQELSLAPDLTVAENILLGVEPTRNGVLDRQSMERSTTKAFAELGRASLRPEQLVGELWLPSNNSSRSRVQLRFGSRVVVLDEPTSSLGRDDVTHLFALIRRLKAKGHAVVYISHFIEEVREVWIALSCSATAAASAADTARCRQRRLCA